MNKIKTTLIALIFIVGINTHIWAADMIRYDFQVDTGEGTRELYRIDVDYSQNTGELCFLNTGSSGIPEETLKLIRSGKIWSKYVDMSKEEHACFKFELHGPFGWFTSPPFKYGSHEYKIVFIGDTKKESIQGKFYQFISYQSGSKITRTSEEYEVSAKGTRINK